MPVAELMTFRDTSGGVANQPGVLPTPRLGGVQGSPAETPWSNDSGGLSAFVPPDEEEKENETPFTDCENRSVENRSVRGDQRADRSRWRGAKTESLEVFPMSSVSTFPQAAVPPVAGSGMAAGPGWTSSAARPVLPVRSSLSLTEALLVALSQLDRAGCVEVFGGNDVVADVLVAQWLADDDLRLSNCSREELVTLDVESCRVVTLDVWGSLVLSAHGTHACGCYGGSLWRMRYGKRPKQMKNGLLSVILAYFDRPKLPPIWSPLEVDPDVEILRLQYMGERFRSTRPCYHTQYINCYLALTSSEAKLIRLTPSVNPNREIALSTYRTDREQSLCRFFCNQHGSMLAATAGRLCALPQSRSLEATGTIARWQSCGAAQSSAGVSGSVFNVRRLLDTSRGASLFCANLPNMRLEGSAESDFTSEDSSGLRSDPEDE